LAAWDVHRARLFGRCEDSTGIAPFDRLVEQVMAVEPYRSARRVFWITENGSAHRGIKAANRLAWRMAIDPTGSHPGSCQWLNQIEIYFSIFQRKALTPNEFASLEDLKHHILAFQDRYQQATRPFHWTFTRTHLHHLNRHPLRPTA
jgi:hypothetical protein